MLGAHSGRQLVERVDVVCGAAPPATAVRHLLTPAGGFELVDGRWRARWLTPEGAELVAGAPGLGVALTGDEPVVDAPDDEALAAVRDADPDDVRAIEYASGADAATLWAAAAKREAAV